METAMQFTYIQFDGKWQTTLAAVMVYKPTAPGQQVLVVAEGATGAKKTYLFKVDSEVYVSYTENIVLLPARCLQVLQGDKTTCSKR